MSNPSYTSKETLIDGTAVSVEHMTFEDFDPEKEQDNQIARENQERMFDPLFIPFYQDLLDLDLSLMEVALYGFIVYYSPRAKSGRFYFTNEQLAKLLRCSLQTISNSVSKLERKGLIETHRKIKANGGQIRFINLVLKSCEPDYKKIDKLYINKLLTNNNKINNNKINNNIVSKDTSKNARIKERNLELIKYYEETIGNKLEGSSQDNWRYCTHLVNRLSAAFPQADPIESTKRLIDAATKDDFHSKNANSFRYLFGNYLKIIKSHQSKLQSVAII